MQVTQIAEVIGIAVDRMNTDALGGTAILTLTEAAVDTSITFVHTRAKTNITAAEGQVQINKDIFSSGFTEFVLLQMAAELTQWVLKPMQRYSP